MKTIEVIYKNRKFNVTQPGKLVYSTVTFVKGCRTDKRMEIVDQLNGCKELTEWRYRSREGYLKEYYDITERDYYIIVVCLGDENKLPRCTYTNPYTGEKCTQFKEFRSLTPMKFQRTGRRAGIFFDGCKDHKNNAAVQNAQRENYQRGVTGLQKADRRSKVWREKLRKSAKRQMERGDSIFSPDSVRRPDIKSCKECVANPSISSVKEVIADLGLVDHDLSVENCILIDKLNYLRKGSPDDTCYYYIAEFEGDSSYFKLGVTINLNKRINRDYHGFRYKNPTTLMTGTRIEIADLEYKVKMKFKEYIVLGNEGFDLKYKDEILEYINELITSSKTM
jgi:hypothetical protein